MPRDPRAATTLITELYGFVPDLAVDSGDTDGLGIDRTFRLTSETIKGLPDVVSAVADKRIVQSRPIAKGVEVRFSPSARLGDVVDPYHVADAATLLSKRRKKKAPPSAG